MDLSELRILATYLSNCSTDAAYNWLNETHLRNLKEEEFPRILPVGKHKAVLDYILLRRKNKLLDLGLAQFGNSPFVLRKLYERGDVGVRCAVLSNPALAWRFNRGSAFDFEKVVRGGNRAELEALALNSYLNDDIYINLMSRKGIFENIPDKEYRDLLCALGKNIRISMPYHGAIDGWAEYSYNSVFNEAWKLAESLPVTDQWAAALTGLLYKAHPPTSFENVESWITRWRDDTAKNPILDFKAELRSCLADLLDPDQKLLNSDDLALRKSFYRRFMPNQFLDWPNFLDKDGEEFLETVITWNTNLWKFQKERDRLKDLAWGFPDPENHMMMPNLFEGVGIRLQKEHPEWFIEQQEEENNTANLNSTVEKTTPTAHIQGSLKGFFRR